VWISQKQCFKDHSREEATNASQLLGPERALIFRVSWDPPPVDSINSAFVSGSLESEYRCTGEVLVPR